MERGSFTGGTCWQHHQLLGHQQQRLSRCTTASFALVVGRSAPLYCPSSHCCHQLGPASLCPRATFRRHNRGALELRASARPRALHWLHSKVNTNLLRISKIETKCIKHFKNECILKIFIFYFIGNSWSSKRCCTVNLSVWKMEVDCRRVNIWCCKYFLMPNYKMQFIKAVLEVFS